MSLNGAALIKFTAHCGGPQYCLETPFLHKSDKK
jgi:hypothetical protein